MDSHTIPPIIFCVFAWCGAGNDSQSQQPQQRGWSSPQQPCPHPPKKRRFWLTARGGGGGLAANQGPVNSQPPLTVNQKWWFFGENPPPTSRPSWMIAVANAFEAKTHRTWQMHQVLTLWNRWAMSPYKEQTYIYTYANHILGHVQQTLTVLSPCFVWKSCVCARKSCRVFVFGRVVCVVCCIVHNFR